MTTSTDAERAWDTPPRGAGWLAFAATMLFVSAGFKFLDALWAFHYDDELSEEVQTVVFEGDLTAWAWVWLVIAVILLAAGVCLLGGSQWARWVGILAAAVAAITFLPWIYYQPLWTILSVTLAVLVIYALAAYGGRHDDWFGRG